MADQPLKHTNGIARGIDRGPRPSVVVVSAASWYGVSPSNGSSTDDAFYLRHAAEILLKSPLSTLPYPLLAASPEALAAARAADKLSLTSDLYGAGVAQLDVPPLPDIPGGLHPLPDLAAPRDPIPVPAELAAGLPPVGAEPELARPLESEQTENLGELNMSPNVADTDAALPTSQPEAPQEPTMPDQPVAPIQEQDSGSPNGPGPQQKASPPPSPAEEGGPAKSVGVPGAVVGGSGKEPDAGLSEDLIEREPPVIDEEEQQEIIERLDPRDLTKLDREIDKLYDKAARLLSGDRKQATVAFELLRKARQYLLGDIEHFAEAEFLVLQVRSLLYRIETSIETGKHYGPRLFAYEFIWMIGLAILAMVTTVSGTAFAAWVGYLMGVPADSEGLNWAVLFLSTLAWGGIGGVTSALWSLHYHISVVRDYDPVENLWYLSQPVLGMVLGGIVYLIMASGFLIVQADLTAASAALGARLLPAAVAVVVGFRQTVVLNLIERVVELIAPSEAEESPPRPTI